MKWNLKKLGVVFGAAALAYVASGMAAYYSDETQAPDKAESLGSGEAWSSPGAATASDDSRASVDASSQTERLTCTEFGFGVSGTIDGIVVHREGRSPNPHPIVGNGVFFKAQLVHGGSLTGDEKNVSGMPGGSSDGFVDAGSDDDTWGATLTLAIVNSDSFGAAYWLNWDSSPGGDEEIDQMKITVYYTTESGQSLSQTRTGRFSR